MNNKIFGEMNYSTGWRAKTVITIFGKAVNVTIKIKAYGENDGITDKQEKACEEFNTNKAQKIKTTETLINEYSGNNAARFTVRTLLFNRDGSYALLFDDAENEDDGIAVCLSPTAKVISQDEYL
jgi:hypothetical protein